MNRYEKLTKDLKESKEIAMKSIKNEDGGTSNLDATFLKLKYWKESRVIQAVKDAGMYCRGKTHWIGDGYMLSIESGQGNDRTRVRNTFVEEMRKRGYDVLHFDKAD